MVPAYVQGEVIRISITIIRMIVDKNIVFVHRNYINVVGNIQVDAWAVVLILQDVSYLPHSYSFITFDDESNVKSHLAVSKSSKSGAKQSALN